MDKTKAAKAMEGLVKEEPKGIPTFHGDYEERFSKNTLYGNIAIYAFDDGSWLAEVKINQPSDINPVATHNPNEGVMKTIVIVGTLTEEAYIMRLCENVGIDPVWVVGRLDLIAGGLK